MLRNSGREGWPISRTLVRSGCDHTGCGMMNVGRLEELDSKRGGKGWKELLEVARAADPDPWRDRFRTAVLNNDRKALVELAASVPISSLPVETVDRLGDAL